MLEDIKRFFADLIDGGKSQEHFGDDDYRVAVAALLVHVATLDGTLSDGERQRLRPILKARFRHDYAGGYWIGAELDGFYAPVSYLNGDDNEVVGAIADASLRAGVKLRGGAEAFLNLRYLAGGSEGIGTDDADPGDGYANNWLHFVTVSAGFRLDVL